MAAMPAGPSVTRRAAPILAGALLCVGLWSAPPGVAGQMALRVQAQSRLNVTAYPVEDGLEVQGTLTDELGVPLGERPLRIQADAAAVAVRTDARGRFTTRFARTTRAVLLRAVFDGDPHQLPTEWQQSIDTARAQVRLTLAVASTRIDLDASSHELTVQATAASDVAGLRVAVRDERGRVLAQGSTDARGRASWRISSRSLGAPGPGQWRASSEADAGRDQAHTELDIVRFMGTQLSLRVQPLQTGALRIEGQLRTRRESLPGRTVTLLLNGQPTFDAKTDAQGRFVRELDRAASGGSTPARDQGDATVIEARYLPEVDWLGASRSPPLALPAWTASTPSALWLLWPLLFCVPALRTLWRRRRTHARASVGPALHDRPSGVVEAGRGQGRAATTQISGQVLDDSTQRPLPEARVWARASDGAECEIGIDAQGRFECADLPTGAGWLHAAAPGFMQLSHPLRLPHRGELSNLRIRLSSARAHALGRLHEVASVAMPPGVDAGRLTPREVAAEAARRHDPPHDLLRGLAERVESAAYARPIPSAEDVAAIEADALRARERLQAPPQPPKHRR